MRSRERRLAGHLGSWDSQIRDVAGSFSLFSSFIFHFIPFYPLASKSLTCTVENFHADRRFGLDEKGKKKK
jgi:hypothetical protein